MTASTPTVLVSPAMAVPAGFYGPVVEALTDRGWPARVVPRRGFGAGPRAGRQADWSYADEIGDLAAALGRARSERPGAPVVVLAHSLGAQVAVAHDLGRPSIEAGRSDGIVAVGASVPYHRCYPRGGLPMLAYGAGVPVIGRLVGHVPPPCFGGPGARTLMTQWARWVRTGAPPFAVPGPLTTPTLVVKLQGDPYAVRRATDAFVTELLDPSAVTRWTYTAGLAPPGGTTDHTRWVRRPEVVLDRLRSWWAERAAAEQRPG